MNVRMRLVYCQYAVIAASLIALYLIPLGG